MTDDIHNVRDPGDVLERTQWDFFWVPEDVRIIDRPELLYASCRRDVPILNTVTRTRAEPDALPALIAEVHRAHDGVRSRWLVRDLDSTRPLKLALERAGYSPAVRTHASAIALGDYNPRSAASVEVRRVVDMTGLSDCVSVIDRAFPGGRAFTEQELEQDLRACTGSAARVVRFVAYDQPSGVPVSSGGMTLFADLQFGLLWGGGTVPEARGRGAYSAVLAARVSEARKLGFGHVGLYAIIDTSAPIVARQGFSRFGTMTYWEREKR